MWELRPGLFEFNDWGRRGVCATCRFKRRFGRQTRRHRPCADEATAALDAPLWRGTSSFRFRVTTSSSVGTRYPNKHTSHNLYTEYAYW